METTAGDKAVSVNVDDRTTGTATAAGRVGLVVTRVEIVIAMAVFGGVLIQPANDARQDAESLASIITHDPNLHTNIGKFGSERQRDKGHVFDGLGVELEDAKVVYGVVIDGIHVSLFVIVEQTVARKGPGWENVNSTAFSDYERYFD
jgi:hypothetical protein